MTPAHKDLYCLDEFIEKMEASRDPELWKKLVDEELKEVEQALADLLKEFADLRYVITGLLTVAPYVDVDEFLCSHSLRFIRVLSLINEDFKDLIDEAFERVHASNMSKLGDDGKPIRREDGKVLKGPNYKPPVLIDLITDGV